MQKFVIKITENETFESVAKRYCITADLLKKENGEIATLENGDRIVIPFKARAIHVVQPLESLQSIAKMYNTTIDSIKSINNVTTIFIGQQLIII